VARSFAVDVDLCEPARLHQLRQALGIRPLGLFQAGRWRRFICHWGVTEFDDLKITEKGNGTIVVKAGGNSVRLLDEDGSCVASWHIFDLASKVAIGTEPDI
jgi:hypothetical protein